MLYDAVFPGCRYCLCGFPRLLVYLKLVLIPRSGLIRTMNKINDSSLFRCPWCLGFEQYMQYHDEEWGVPVRNDRVQFEFLVLESAQAGLSWATILRKREAYREAFAGFDLEKVARFDAARIDGLLLQENGIVRNRAKIEAAVNNAGRFLDLQARFGSFSSFIWNFIDGQPIVNHWKRPEEVPATSRISDRLAKEMKSEGFKFLGSTTLYAHMQATGLVNDHLVDCYRHREVSGVEEPPAR